MQGDRVGADVEELVGGETGVGRGGDVAQVVGAGAAGAEAELGEAGEDGDGVARLDLAELEIAAGGDVGVAAAEVLGEVGEAVELVAGDAATGEAEAEHEALLGGGDVEEAVPTEAVVVLGVGVFVGGGVGEESIPAVERMLGVFPFLLLAKIVHRGGVEDGGGGGGGLRAET